MELGEDTLVFDTNSVASCMASMEPTKRTVVSMVARFFDPLGVVTPITIQFKIFFQQLCEARVKWDDPLEADLRQKWDQLQSSLAGVITIPRPYFPHIVK